MTVKEYLEQIRLFEIKHQNRIRQLEMLRADISPIRGLTYDNVHVQTSPSKSTRTELAIDRVVDLENELMQEAADLAIQRQRIIDQIEAVADARYVQLLSLKYINGYTLHSAACLMGYSYDWARKAHVLALKAFYDANKKNNAQ